jgi:hypothetical protein
MADCEWHVQQVNALRDLQDGPGAIRTKGQPGDMPTPLNGTQDSLWGQLAASGYRATPSKCDIQSP